MLVLVSGMSGIALPYTWQSICDEIGRHQHYLFYTMWLLCLAGLLGISITGDASTSSSFWRSRRSPPTCSIALGRDRRALVAAYQYLIMGTIGATFIVIGVGLLYLMTGTLNIADMGHRIGAVQGTRPVVAALAFLTVGISLKLALFPLHQWLPNAYAYAPSSVSAFLAATATKVAVYILLRFYFTVFGEAAVFDRLPTSEAMLLLALAGMFAASAIAIYQTDLKRLFAYSSVGQIGYIILGLSFNSQTGLTTIVHLFNHGVTKGAIFMLLGGVALRAGGTSLAHIQGLGKRMPLISLGIVICGLSLVGVPGTAGFVSKWYPDPGCAAEGPAAAGIPDRGVVAVALIYVWRFVEAAYLQGPPADATALREATAGHAAARSTARLRHRVVRA